jgi:hypothetical protein
MERETKEMIKAKRRAKRAMIKAKAKAKVKRMETMDTIPAIPAIPAVPRVTEKADDDLNYLLLNDLVSTLLSSTNATITERSYAHMDTIKRPRQTTRRERYRVSASKRTKRQPMT